MTELPKMKRAVNRTKITLYFDSDVAEIYRIGKNNGWDVSEMVRIAASEILRTNQESLAKKATPGR